MNCCTKHAQRLSCYHQIKVHTTTPRNQESTRNVVLVLRSWTLSLSLRTKYSSTYLDDVNHVCRSADKIPYLRYIGNPYCYTFECLYRWHSTVTHIRFWVAIAAVICRSLFTSLSILDFWFIVLSWSWHPYSSLQHINRGKWIRQLKIFLYLIYWPR